jgi:hypothetical protein
MHTSTAVKIYTAISTLLYATLSIARANELDFFIDNRKQVLVDYINSFQSDEDGLYYDKNIQNQ